MINLINDKFKSLKTNQFQNLVQQRTQAKNRITTAT